MRVVNQQYTVNSVSDLYKHLLRDKYFATLETTGLDVAPNKIQIVCYSNDDLDDTSYDILRKYSIAKLTGSISFESLPAISSLPYMTYMPPMPSIPSTSTTPTEVAHPLKAFSDNPSEYINIEDKLPKLNIGKISAQLIYPYLNSIHKLPTDPDRDVLTGQIIEYAIQNNAKILVTPSVLKRFNIVAPEIMMRSLYFKYIPLIKSGSYKYTDNYGNESLDLNRMYEQMQVYIVKDSEEYYRLMKAFIKYAQTVGRQVNSDTANKFFPPQQGGSNYKGKYIKYKLKYMRYKNK